jgi:hypothetical protein
VRPPWPILDGLVEESTARPWRANRVPNRVPNSADRPRSSRTQPPDSPRNTGIPASRRAIIIRVSGFESLLRHREVVANGLFPARAKCARSNLVPNWYRALADDEHRPGPSERSPRCPPQPPSLFPRRALKGVCRASPSTSGHVFLREGKRGSVWYAKYRLPDGRQVKKRIGPAATVSQRSAEAWLRGVLDEARRGPEL